MNDLLKEYREVKDQLAALDVKKAELEMKIFDAFDEDGITNKETPFGSFFIMGRKTWEYSNDVKEFQLELAKKKKVEELQGIATLKKDSMYLRLVLPKTE
jgi:hypothetical protein